MLGACQGRHCAGRAQRHRSGHVAGDGAGGRPSPSPRTCCTNRASTPYSPVDNATSYCPGIRSSPPETACQGHRPVVAVGGVVEAARVRVTRRMGSASSKSGRIPGFVLRGSGTARPGEEPSGRNGDDVARPGRHQRRTVCAVPGRHVPDHAPVDGPPHRPAPPQAAGSAGDGGGNRPVGRIRRRRRSPTRAAGRSGTGPATAFPACPGSTRSTCGSAALPPVPKPTARAVMFCLMDVSARCRRA